MVAEALISALVKKLASVLGQEVELLVGVKDEIEKLKHTFEKINAVLKDADRKQVKDESVKQWLEDLKNVAYDMEDGLEEWSFRDDHPRSLMDQVLSCLSSLCFCFKPVGLRHSVGHKIKHIRQRLDFIAEEKNKFQLVETIGWAVNEQEGPCRELTSSVIDVSDTFGRDLDKDVIKSKLTSESSHASLMLKLPIIAIVGMGGLGKTTLAQIVYNDEQVREHFENTMWVCVSDPFDKVRLAKAIIEETNGQGSSALEWNALHNELSDAVKDRRFLLVLDDVWTDDPLQWEPLKISLNFGAQGSRVLVTTRNEGVAVMMNATHTHRIGELPEPGCWSLFSRIAFAGWSEHDKHKLELEEMGRKIVKKCKGVPLSVKTLAGLMHNKKHTEDWQHVLESDLWNEDEVANKILPALLLSYYDLSPNSKRCFAYCAVFPKDYVFEKDKLIKLWMAHGFLNSKGEKELEKIGDEYFDDLVMRSFFQDIEKDENGSIISCKMHDLVHDLAQFLAKDECLVVERNITQIDGKKIRHITPWVKDIVLFDLSAIYNIKKLRTLFAMNSKGIYGLFHHLRFLRVLDLSGNYIQIIPSEVENLKHLRYFDLSRSYVANLPVTLCDLHNLQTLRLNCCFFLRELPEGLGKMTSLRHLEIYDTKHLRYMPRGIGQLLNLRSLNKFILTKKSGGCKLGELKDLMFLRGELVIRGLGKWSNASEANEANLKGKKYLSSVTLDFYCEELENVGHGDVERMEDVLEGLQIHANVNTLILQGYLGSKFPRWMMSGAMISLKLRCLTLENCGKCKHFPALGRLPFLETLYITGMEVQCIDRVFLGIDDNTDRISFPKLIKLHITNMKSLAEWQEVEDNVDIMPQLQDLYLGAFPMLVALPPLGKLKSLKTLTINNMESVKCIGLEFFGIRPYDVQNEGVDSKDPATKVAFPQLITFTLESMKELEEWEFPIVQHPNIMPCLQDLCISDCYELRELPALGILNSLERLTITSMNSVKRIGFEFLGIMKDNVGSTKPITIMTAFPRLSSLTLETMENLEEWELPVGEDIEIMPCLHNLKMLGCPIMRTLPPLGKLKSLELLEIARLDFIKHVGLEFLGISVADWTRRGDDGEPLSIIAFPKLKQLEFMNLLRWEEWDLIPLPRRESDEINYGSGGIEYISITTPCLNRLLISDCRRLKVMPRNISSCTPWKLEIKNCPKLHIANTQGMAKLQELNVDGKPICLA